MSYEETFFLEKMRLKAIQELEERIEKHLKNEFYHRILPKVVNDVKKNVVVEVTTSNDTVELVMKIKE